VPFFDVLKVEMDEKRRYEVASALGVRRHEVASPLVGNPNPAANTRTRVYLREKYG